MERNPKKNLALRILIGLALVVFIALMFPHPESMDYNYSIGGVWADKDLVAPFSFPVFKDPREYEKEQDEAVRNARPVFERHDEITSDLLDSARVLFDSLERAAQRHIRMWGHHVVDDSVKLAGALSHLPLALTRGEWNFIQENATNAESGGTPPLRTVEVQTMGILADLLRVGIIDRWPAGQPKALLALRKGTMEEVMPFDRFCSTDQASDLLASRLASTLGESSANTLAFKIGRAVLQPNVLFDQVSSNREVQAAADNVPRTIGFVQANERIIGKHERITDEVKLKLDSFRKARAERGSIYDLWEHWLGSGLHIVLVIGLYAVYLFLFRKKIFHDNGCLTLIALLLLMETFFAYLSLVINLQEPVQYLIFVPAASMLLAIIFDSRVAFYGTVTVAMLVAGIRGNDYSIALTSLVAGALGAYTVRDIRNRTQIFRSLIFIFAGYAVSIIALSLEQFESLNTIAMSLTFALANAVFSPVLTYGLLIFFEELFGITTELTLVELSDFNQPLLRMLSEKAPGTFNHSITIGNLAEAAAEAIGAGAILARVGGYYHDIGKILKAEYFVENQVGSQNRHGRLKPRMSALIIASHVREGVDLGREHGLPERVLDFVSQHHGTTRISFFYDKALRQAARRPTKDVISEEDFSYPGPKPQTKEAGIVMLADSVEASTRALTEISPQRLEQSIENMIRHRFIEGQLDDCELTLRDLTKIKEAFLKILIGIHHQRLAYPEQPSSEERGPSREPTDGTVVQSPALSGVESLSPSPTNQQTEQVSGDPPGSAEAEGRAAGETRTDGSDPADQRESGSGY